MLIYNPPTHYGLTILYLDDFLLIVEKPAGLLSVPGRGEARQDCLISRVQMEYPEALIVHRLDMSTSGLMVVARGKALERALSILFQTRQVAKRYTAIVSGLLPMDSGEINLPLITDWPNRPKQMVCFARGKPSLTRYRVIAHERLTNTTQVELEPITGRSHQLRVHLQAIGHPILGDELYASETVQAQAQRLLLHASQLSFKHPITHEMLLVNSRAPFPLHIGEHQT